MYLSYFLSFTLYGNFSHKNDIFNLSPTNEMKSIKCSFYFNWKF